MFPLPGASDRELEVWAELWRTPQAVAWDREPWRHRIVGHYVRWSVRAEDPECSGTVLGQVHRLADQVGLTPAGLVENGWAIASDEVGAKRGEAVEESAPKAAPVRRLRAVGGEA